MIEVKRNNTNHVQSTIKQLKQNKYTSQEKKIIQKFLKIIIAKWN